MRRSGTLRTWKDDEGFGFIVPDGGGDDVFVHISAFPGRGKSRRPTEGEVLSYVPSTDGKGRPRAEDVSYTGGAAVSEVLGRRGSVPIGFGLLFLAALAIAAGLQRLPWAVPLAALGMSVLTFLVYAVDKSAAQAGRRRIPESTLHGFSLLGGWPGAILAQQTLRHKSSKASFQVVFWLTVALNIVVVVALTSPAARRAVLAMLGADRS